MNRLMLSTVALGIALWGLGLPGPGGPTRAAAEDEAPKDPTRGDWDGFLDPVRDAEDTLTGWQGSLEEKSKVHVMMGISQGWEWNFNDPGRNAIGDLMPNTLRSLDYYHNAGDLDLLQARINRPSEGWIPGFGVTLDVGDIAKRIKSDWNGNGVVKRGDFFEKSNFDAEEVYLQYSLGDEAGPLKGLSIKGGKFVTLLGAEVIEPWSNYNYSRSFLFGFAIPFTNTGVLATYPIFDTLSVSFGGVVGWDNVADNNNSPSFMGNVTWTATDWATLGVNGIYGPEQTNNIGNKRDVVDVVATIKPCDPITFLLNYDNGSEENAVNNGTRNANWQGFSGIINYAITPRFSTAFRGEWFEDSGGTRTGLSQNLFETTLTLKYLITQHLYSRIEYRHDESNKDNVFVAGSTKLLPGQDTLGFEFGYVFN